MRTVLLAIVASAIWGQFAWDSAQGRVQAIGICLGPQPLCIGANATCICDGMNNCHWECVRP